MRESTISRSSKRPPSTRSKPRSVPRLGPHPRRTPQHQSTCGLNFNEPVKANGPWFGPAVWAGDALVTGYSRGKLYRTTLALAPAGYVARTNLLGCLSMLTVDACISPDGGLVISCHSGQVEAAT